jgi:Epoxide hydrolase N terminus
VPTDGDSVADGHPRGRVEIWADIGDLRTLCDYWQNTYDWRSHEKRLNRPDAGSRRPAIDASLQQLVINFN